jgi:shikimate kinase
MNSENNSTSLNQRLKGINIYLIGMMGVGKSTIGRLLQTKLEYGFCDTDAVIEGVAKKKIADIFRDDGEQAFRDVETQVMNEIAAYTRLVVATGGGIVERTQNWSYLHQGLIIWLDAPLEVLISRIAEDANRPLAAEVESRLQKRQPLYAQADLKIEATGTPESVVEAIVATIPQVLKT